MKKWIVPIGMWIITASYIGLIFFLSLQNGQDTTDLSLGLSGDFNEFLMKLGIMVSGDQLHLWLRTTAHVLEFLGLGLLTETAVQVTLFYAGPKGSKNRNAWLLQSLALVICICVAVLSEVLKLYIPGRHLHWNEAWLNIVYVLLGGAVAYAVSMIYANKRRMRS